MAAMRNMVSLARKPRPELRFLDPSMQDDFDRNGYVIVDVLPRCGLDHMRTLFDDIADEASPAFYVTLDGRSYLENRRVSDRIVELMSPGLTRVLTGFDVVGATFLAKQARSDSVLPIHQDWSSVDERRDIAVNVWTPLVETNALNGTLQVLPGSHRWFSNPRSPWCPSVEMPLDGPLRPHLHRLDLAAGRTVIYDNRLFHGSGANNSGDVRPVAQIGIVNRGALTVMATNAGLGQIELRPVNPSAFFVGSERSVAGPEFLDGYPPTVVPTRSIATDEVLAHCKTQSEVVKGRQRTWTRAGNRAGRACFGKWLPRFRSRGLG